MRDRYLNVVALILIGFQRTEFFLEVTSAIKDQVAIKKTSSQLKSANR